MYFPLRTAFAVSQRFWMVISSFSLVSMNLFNSSLISWLTLSSFIRMLFNLHVFEFLPNFFLWLSSSFKTLWSENMQEIIPIFWYQLRPDLWPSMWSILEKVPCALEKNVYSVVSRWKVLYISVKSIWSSVSFKALVSLETLCLEDVSFAESVVLKSPSISVLLSKYVFTLVINWYTWQLPH